MCWSNLLNNENTFLIVTHISVVLVFYLGMSQNINSTTRRLKFGYISVFTNILEFGPVDKPLIKQTTPRLSCGFSS